MGTLLLLTTPTSRPEPNYPLTPPRNLNLNVSFPSSPDKEGLGPETSTSVCGRFFRFSVLFTFPENTSRDTLSTVCVVSEFSVETGKVR